VTERRNLTPDLAVVRLQPEIPYAFTPGQYCTIGLDGVERPYSIVSSPHEAFLELFLELVPHGRAHAEALDAAGGRRGLSPSSAEGRLHPRGEFPVHLMVATVTGIAPFVSMLRHVIHRGERRFRFVVLQGASYQDEFAYREELEAASARHPELLAYIPTVSRPGEERNRGWAGATGRVNTVVEEHVERLGLPAESTAAYACGHPGMIEDVARRLTPRDFLVKEEKYWKE